MKQDDLKKQIQRLDEWAKHYRVAAEMRRRLAEEALESAQEHDREALRYSEQAAALRGQLEEP